MWHSPSLPPWNFTRTLLSRNLDKSKILSFFLFSDCWRIKGIQWEAETRDRKCHHKQRDTHRHSDVSSHGIVGQAAWGPGPSGDTTLTEKTWNLIYEVLRRNWPKWGPKSRSLFRKASALAFWMYFSCVALFVIKNEEERAWHSAVWQNTGSSRNISEYFNG